MIDWRIVGTSLKSSQDAKNASVDLRAVPWQDLLAELDRRRIIRVALDGVPDAILRREFGRRLRKDQNTSGNS